MKNIFFIISILLFLGCNGQQPTTLKVQPSRSVQAVNMQAKYILTVWNSRKQKFERHNVLTYHRNLDWVSFACIDGKKTYALELHWSGVSNFKDNKGNLINF